MELGSEVCTPRAYRCMECPVAVLCRANQQGRQQEIPSPKRKPATQAVPRRPWWFAIVAASCCCVGPKAAAGPGCGIFPAFRWPAESPAEIGRELVEHVRALTGVTVHGPAYHHPHARRHAIPHHPGLLRGEIFSAEQERRLRWKPAGCDRQNWATTR